VTLTDAYSTTLTIPTLPDKILEHSESVQVRIIDSDLGGLDNNITVAPASYDIFIHYAGGALDYGQEITSTAGNDIVLVTQENDSLVGGGSEIFVWNSSNMGQDADALDIITDFTKGDVLRFEDLLATHGEEAQNALTAMINNGEWQEHAQGGGTFTATDQNGSGIRLSIAETAATLTVSYTHEEQQYTQNVELQNFDIGQFHQEDALDHAAVQEMLHEIIKVGGSA
jgi:Ca2+-binding RTX toxin-like protein